MNDCGHLCCGERRGDGFHDHFLGPDECPACAYQRGAAAESNDDAPSAPSARTADRNGAPQPEADDRG